MIVGSIILAALLIAPQSSASNEQATASENHMEILRAKREIPGDEFSKRAPMGFQGMRGKKDLAEVGAVKDNNLIERDFEKRAPMGFQGMRGKKNDLLAPDLDEAFYHEDYEKRGPMGFQSTRGKKAMLDDEYDKRAMMGFQGMRGKKSLEEVLDDLDKRVNMPYKIPLDKFYINEYPDEYEKRAAMGFQGMRGKKDDYETGEWEKRAPMGFQGMRGKKNFLEELEEMEKRAIMGFQGMRGKKDDEDNYYEYLMDPMEYEKRAPMGFQGMRGKKDGDKRGSMGFVGMRGKRDVPGIYDTEDTYHERVMDMPDLRFVDNSIQIDKRALRDSSGFRGKKIPRWEIRGKFVGVRGKKRNNWTPTNIDNSDNAIGLKTSSAQFETQ